MTVVKCLVWDLDNTLWQGILLEDGEVHVSDEIRRTVVDLDARGILQSVASRNDHDEAWARLEKLGLAEFFVLPQIGWGRKSDAVRTIADGLMFAHDTIAFVDDQPAERAEVAYHLPAVRCYRAEDAAGLADRPEFTPPVVTADAGRRRRMYQEGQRRDAERAAFTGPDEDFLRSLDLTLRIDHATSADIARLEELTLRTSQMNATGVHYTDADLRALTADPDHDVLVISLTDRFGPHGAVGVALLRRYPAGAAAASWHLKLLATSCRVVAFGTGAMILRWLTDQAARAGAHLVADFRPTDRNRMMEIAYRFAGFGDTACPCAAPLPPAGGIHRLHLEPVRQSAPTTLSVAAVDLGGGERDVHAWTCARP